MTTDKFLATQTASLLAAHGVRRVVLSPGTRNAPLLVALSRHESIECVTVVDERSAAFIALGMAVQTGKSVAVVCTSGTALLNYGPAVAEAYYRNIPMVVISADRPACWIDQADSQTLKQTGALANVVKASYDVGNETETSDDGRWYANRTINEAILTAMASPAGPVHLNLRFDAPLNGLSCNTGSRGLRVIRTVTSRADMPVAQVREISCRLASPRRILVVAGIHTPSGRLNKALMRLSALPNFVVMTEPVANMHLPDAIDSIDRVLATLTSEQRVEMLPDVVITVGGAIVSGRLKQWLRSASDAMEHWHVGQTRNAVDTFRHLTLRIELDEDIFFGQLASAMQPHRRECDYGFAWRKCAARASVAHDLAIAGSTMSGWSDLVAFSRIIPSVDRRWNLHLSNGTPVRYASLFDCRGIHRVDCNRGVSGIDGSTSTALGASMVYSDVTLFVSGDMGALYDLSALAQSDLPARFKMVVMANGGGSIFRVIDSTRHFEELNERFACCRQTDVDWHRVASTFGMACFEIDGGDDFDRVWSAFASETGRASMLVVRTCAETSAREFTDYFKKIKEIAINEKVEDNQGI